MFAGQPVALLDWATIWQRWKEVSTRAEPRTARVVEIALSYIRITRRKQCGQIGMLMRCESQIVAHRFSVVERVFGFTWIGRFSRTLAEA